MREPRDLDQYIEGLHEVGADDLTMHLLRTLVLERFTALDAALNDVLAMCFARDQQSADVLAYDVFARLSMDHRTSMLKRIMEAEELTDRWPFLLQVLPLLSTLRNALAHGFVQRLPDDQFQIITVNKGRGRRYTYSSQELAWLTWQSQVVWTELRSLWATLVPDVDDWFGPDAQHP